MAKWHWYVSLYIYSLDYKDRFMLPYKIIEVSDNGAEGDDDQGGFTIIKRFCRNQFNILNNNIEKIERAHKLDFDYLMQSIHALDDNMNKIE